MPRLGAHAPIEIMALSDVQIALDLLRLFLAELSATTINQLISFLPAK